MSLFTSKKEFLDEIEELKKTVNAHKSFSYVQARNIDHLAEQNSRLLGLKELAKELNDVVTPSNAFIGRMPDREEILNLKAEISKLSKDVEQRDNIIDIRNSSLEKLRNELVYSKQQTTEWATESMKFQKRASASESTCENLRKSLEKHEEAAHKTDVITRKEFCHLNNELISNQSSYSDLLSKYTEVKEQNSKLSTNMEKLNAEWERRMKEIMPKYIESVKEVDTLRKDIDADSTQKLRTELARVNGELTSTKNEHMNLYREYVRRGEQIIELKNALNKYDPGFTIHGNVSMAEHYEIVKKLYTETKDDFEALKTRHHALLTEFDKFAEGISSVAKTLPEESED